MHEKNEYARALREYARGLLLGYLAAADGNASAAARAAGLNRTHFYELLTRHGIPVPGARRAEPRAPTLALSWKPPRL